MFNLFLQYFSHCFGALYPPTLIFVDTESIQSRKLRICLLFFGNNGYKFRLCSEMRKYKTPIWLYDQMASAT